MRSPNRSRSRWWTFAPLAIAIVAAGCSQPPYQSSIQTPRMAAADSPPDLIEDLFTSRTAGAVEAAPPGVRRRVDFGRSHVDGDARRIAEWVADSGDNRELPFIIVDKANAKVMVFSGDSHLRGVAPALLGLAKGDDSVPGIGERKIADIKPEERTTPAGRFAAEMGVNTGGEDILWVDYDSAVSMHRVRATNPVERRLQRLASPKAADHRISYGCINLPAKFYDQIVKPLFAPHNGVVYVLPETRSAQQLFNAYTVTRVGTR